MKICQECGSENKDESKFCGSCGADLSNVAAEPQSTFEQTPETTNQEVYKPHGNKNKWLGSILDIIGGLILYLLCGIGQIYLGLTKRGLVLCGIGLGVIILNMIFISISSSVATYFIILIIGIALTLYSAYDAYVCAIAINEGKPIPLLFGKFDFQ
ncbi:MAG: zinc ribbon domain-containing protein [Methanobrevibacter sp.]|nr:zinc ribbon domain-containing protein [Methanobrevibacter sp.]